MANYIQLSFTDITQDLSDQLVACLSESGFEGFEEIDNGLKAFIPEDQFDEAALEEIVVPLQARYTKTFIEETNWNKLWESNFEPVVVDDFVGVRADFHDPITYTKFEIVITPKMSFGTGHHATTYMMMRQMKGIDFKNKSVFDFGTGTGLLAILAEKLGAKKVLAVDNDEWSIANSDENIKRNQCGAITLKWADKPVMHQQFDIILANINKNVILGNFEALRKHLSAEGLLLLSGLLAEDEKDILALSNKSGMTLLQREERQNWLFLMLTP